MYYLNFTKKVNVFSVEHLLSMAINTPHCRANLVRGNATLYSCLKEYCLRSHSFILNTGKCLSVLFHIFRCYFYLLLLSSFIQHASWNIHIFNK